MLSKKKIRAHWAFKIPSFGMTDSFNEQSTPLYCNE